ncbi:MAG: hypothetical protein PHD51_03285 [Patescibacteria group bacterium]|nr:hypothetical protein [Patescibacteria group bacterium]MDD5490998.1 hypothetical protein [Patescibacteria group bacterium]
MAEKAKKNPFLVCSSDEKCFLVEIEGTERLLMDQMTGEEIVETLIRRKRQQAKTDVSLEDLASESIYRDGENKIIIPAVNLLSCLREAGKQIPWGATSSKKRITKADGTTMLHSFLKIPDANLILELPEEGVNKEGWAVDVRKGKLKDGTAVGIVRPLFREWSFKVKIYIDFYTSEVTPEMVGKLFFTAGKSVGLCAFRPACGGPFGTFHVKSWEEVKAPAAEEAA